MRLNIELTVPDVQPHKAVIAQILRFTASRIQGDVYRDLENGGIPVVYDGRVIGRAAISDAPG